MRRSRTLIAFLPLLVIGGARSSTLAPVYPQAIQIVSHPVGLQDDDPERTRAGRLKLIAGWQMTSLSHQFGGWSALAVDGDRVTAVGDYGSILRFRLTRFGRAVDARIDPLPSGCGRQDDKTERDSEALSRTPDGWWIGYEFDNRLCKVTPDFDRALALRRPTEMAKWPVQYGAEAVLRLRDGRVLVFAERAPAGLALRPLLVFGGDPANPATKVAARSYIPPPGYSPTDAAELPDGRILVLNRRFALADRFTSVLTVFDSHAFDVGTAVTGTPVAVLAPPTLHDNFEGLAVTVEGERAVVWMISDDNFMSWQKTYLLKFALD